MGQSNDAKLYFGIQMEDEGMPEWMGDFCDFDDFILSKSGLTEEKIDQLDWKEKKALVEACPVKLFEHCSYEYTMYILGVRGMEFSASRGYPVEISVNDLDTQNEKTLEKIEAFRVWCRNNDIELTEEPKWLLCSMNG